MNERIRELMEEAGIYDFVVESMGINEEMEKFAELIVRECGKVVYNYTNKTETHILYGEVGWECLPGDLQIQIKEHFGVGMSTEDKKTLIKELLGVKNND